MHLKNHLDMCNEIQVLNPLLYHSLWVLIQNLFLKPLKKILNKNVIKNFKMFNINMYHTSRQIFQKDHLFTLFSTFRDKYDSNALSTLIIKEAPANPLIQQFFKKELEHEMQEYTQQYDTDSKMFLELFKCEWRIFYWFGLFAIFGDNSSLSDKLVLDTKMQMMADFMNNIKTFIMSNCFDNKVKIMSTNTRSLHSLTSKDQNKFYIAKNDSQEIILKREEVKISNKDISLDIPQYLFEPIQRKAEEDHLIFLWMKLLSGKKVDIKDFFEQSVNTSSREKSTKGIYTMQDTILKGVDDHKMRVELRRNKLKSKLIENRNQEVQPLVSIEFLYSPKFNSQLMTKFQSTMFYNLNTTIDYQDQDKPFLLGNEINELNSELKQVSGFFNLTYSNLPKTSSIRFFSGNSELINRFKTMPITPENLRKLYKESIKKLKETISNIIKGNNECVFEPHILSILVFILSEQAKKKFSKIDNQFQKCYKLSYEDLKHKPYYFVKCLKLKTPKLKDNLGVYTDKLNEIIQNKIEYENKFLKLIGIPKNAPMKTFHNYSLYPNNYLMNQARFGNFSSMGMYRNPLNRGMMSNINNPNLFYRSDRSIENQKDSLKIVNKILNEVRNTNKRIILSGPILQYLNSIALEHRIIKVFEKNPIFDFKELCNLFKELQYRDQNKYLYEKAKVIFGRSRDVHNKICNYNEQFCSELQANLSSPDFNLKQFELSLGNLTSSRKLDIYQNLMQESLDSFYIGRF